MLRNKYQQDFANGQVEFKFETVNKDFQRHKIMQQALGDGLQIDEPDQLEEGVDKEDFFHGMNKIESSLSKKTSKKIEGDEEMVILSIKNPENTEKEFYVPKKFYDLLKEHQKQACTWLVTQMVHDRGSILADEMGLGKTISAISLLVALYTTNRINNKVSGPTLVVCPATIIKQWDQEIKAWAKDYLPEVMLYNSQ